MIARTSRLASLLTTLCITLVYLQAAEATCAAGTQILPAWLASNVQVNLTVGNCTYNMSSGANVMFTIDVINATNLSYVLVIGTTPKCQRFTVAVSTYKGMPFAGKCGDTVSILAVKAGTDWGQTSQAAYDECFSIGLAGSNFGTSYPPTLSNSPGCRTFFLKNITIDCKNSNNKGAECNLNGPKNGTCDAQDVWTDACTCPDKLLTSDTKCRALAVVDVGIVKTCDVEEFCNGRSKECPPDAFAPSSKVCRAAQSASDGTTCDIPETCTGLNASCPSDAFAPKGKVCRPDQSTSPDNKTCDIPETCTGLSASCPPDVLVSNGTVCRPDQSTSPDNKTCDIPETCTGLSASCPPDALLPKGTVCRPDQSTSSDGTTCDIPETCTGISASCPDDVRKDESTICRIQKNSCDAPEYCNGDVNCPLDVCKGSTPDFGFTCVA